MKFRLIGVVLLIASAAMAFIGLIQPLQQAAAGHASVLDGAKAVILLPLAVMLGLALLAGGEPFFNLVASHGAESSPTSASPSGYRRVT